VTPIEPAPELALTQALKIPPYASLLLPPKDMAGAVRAKIGAGDGI
jgi:hypothetical protein